MQTENFKGIEFIQISKLPEEQRKLIVLALPSDNIIKILKENELLTDCVQYKHYEEWYGAQFKVQVSPQPVTIAENGAFKLALTNPTHLRE